MGAGAAARAKARQLAESAESHRRQAAFDDRDAANWLAGARGEEALELALSPLFESGWWPLADRRKSSAGGNIDELLVGPAGVAVLDAKNWSNPACCKNGRLYSGGFPRTEDVAGVSKQVEIVERALAVLPYRVAVRGFLAFTGPSDLDYEPELLTDVWLVGLRHLVPGFRRVSAVLELRQRYEVYYQLDREFPPMVADDPVPGPDMERHDPVAADPRTNGHQRDDVLTWYLNPWQRYGRSTLYLNDMDGTLLGWKDLRTGEVSTSSQNGHRTVVQRLLWAAGIAGFDPDKLAAATADRQWVENAPPVLIGQEWRRRDQHRLYGTYICPARGPFSLGHVDLRTGELTSSVRTNLPPDLGSPLAYLRHLNGSWPGWRRQ